MYETGELLDVEAGAPAHGGFCIARAEDGRVVLLRHALPGEQVRARVSEDRGGSFLRADAVEVLRASADRVEPPCPHAGPGRCGGCDWQHAAGQAQRAIKQAVVRDQFARLAGLELPPDFHVEALSDALLGWRTRVTYAATRQGELGLHRHRSHEIEPVEACPLGLPGVGDSDLLARRWVGLTGVEVVRDSSEQIAVVGHRPGPGRQARGRRPPDRVELLSGPDRVSFEVLGRTFTVDPAGFWQVHPQALAAFVGALLDAAAPRPGERVLDLYAGAGALTAFLAERVGPTGRVVGVESAPGPVRDAAGNLAELPWAEVRRARLDVNSVPALAALGAEVAPDVIVLDPPRAGAGKPIMQTLCAMPARVIAYVACDPAALARDAAVALAEGWQLARIRGFDAFPMTHHVECVATFARD